MRHKKTMTLYASLIIVFAALGLTGVGCSNDSLALGSGHDLANSGVGFEDRALFDPSLACLPPDHTASSTRTTQNCSSQLWQIWNGTSCKCGSHVHGIVKCINRTEVPLIGILQCYCPYHADGQHIGACLHGCFQNNRDTLNLYTIYSSTSQFNLQCQVANRRDPLCGSCNSSDYGAPAYSFSLKCRKCEFSVKNIIRYIAIAYGPLTLFFAIIVIFTVSVNSAPLHGYIFVTQMMATSTLLRTLQLMSEIRSLYRANVLQYVSIAFTATVYGVWNLDFFRFVNHYYCLHPSLSTLTIMSLDYLIAVYPLVLIVVMYVLVLLHSQGYRILVYMWKPFNCCFVQFRRRLNIRTTLVDAFGTFFSLSYVKFLSTTVDLLTPTPVWNVNGTHVSDRVYYDGNLIYMQGSHLPYAVVGLIFFSLFNILPIIFLLLYPRHFFQRRIPPSVRRILHPFMDTLLGIYKDGTDGGYDCRFFVVVYPISRIAILGMFTLTLNSFCFVLITFVTSITAMLVAVIKPYKSTAYNTVDTILVTILALMYAALSSFFLASAVSLDQLPFSRVLLVLTILFPFLYMCGLVVYKICKTCKVRQRNRRMLQQIILCFGKVYIYLVDRLNRGQELEAFISYDERTQLINNRDLSR